MWMTPAKNDFAKTLFVGLCLCASARGIRLCVQTLSNWWIFLIFFFACSLQNDYVWGYKKSAFTEIHAKFDGFTLCERLYIIAFVLPHESERIKKIKSTQNRNEREKMLRQDGKRKYKHFIYSPESRACLSYAWPRSKCNHTTSKSGTATKNGIAVSRYRCHVWFMKM